jgi:hypothetical protein
MQAKSAAQLRVIPTAQEVKIGKEKIESLDLTGIKKRLQSCHGWTEQECNTIEPQYKAFLGLHLEHHGQNLTPTQKIDDMWHAHILHTRKYVAFCEDVFGCYLHHNPHAVEVSDEVKRQEQFLNTKELLVNALGQAGLGLNTHLDAAICDGGAYCD